MALLSSLLRLLSGTLYLILVMLGRDPGVPLVILTLYWIRLISKAGARLHNQVPRGSRALYGTVVLLTLAFLVRILHGIINVVEEQIFKKG